MSDPTDVNEWAEHLMWLAQQLRDNDRDVEFVWLAEGGVAPAWTLADQLDLAARNIKTTVEPTDPEWRFPIPLYALLDVWTSLGGDSRDFDAWVTEPKRTPADAWSQLMAAVGRNIRALTLDTNPPAGALLDLVQAHDTNTADGV